MKVQHYTIDRCVTLGFLPFDSFCCCFSYSFVFSTLLLSSVPPFSSSSFIHSHGTCSYPPLQYSTPGSPLSFPPLSVPPALPSFSQKLNSSSSSPSSSPSLLPSLSVLCTSCIYASPASVIPPLLFLSSSSSSSSISCLLFFFFSAQFRNFNLYVFVSLAFSHSLWATPPSHPHSLPLKTDSPQAAGAAVDSPGSSSLFSARSTPFPS